MEHDGTAKRSNEYLVLIRPVCAEEFWPVAIQRFIEGIQELIYFGIPIYDEEVKNLGRRQLCRYEARTQSFHNT